MEAAWCIHVLPQLQAAQSLWAWPRARSRLVPGIPGGNTASLLQVQTIHLSWLNQFWPSFCFLVLLYFSTSLVRDGETGASSVASGSDNQESAPVLSPVLLLHQSYSPLHLSIRVWDCRSLSRRTGEVFHADYRGGHLSAIDCVVLLFLVPVNWQNHRVKFGWIWSV